MIVFELAFWILIGSVCWTYAGYPLMLMILVRHREPRRRAAIEPSVTVIIAAYNEERDIRSKIENTLALDYPRDKLQVIVASDASTDGTHDIVQQFADAGVELVALPERGGKTAAQNAGAARAKGEVLIFTDATTALPRHGLRRLLEPLGDPQVGCVGAELEYVSEEGTAIGRGGGLYWRYEKKIKALESRVNSLIGVSGCLYAVRADLYTPIAPDLISDFVIALDTYGKQRVTVLAPGAVSQEKTHEAADREFTMRTRVIVRTIHALVRQAHMLNPLRYGFFAVQLWSHKVLRYLVPELLIAAFLVNVILAVGGNDRALLYQLLLAGQAMIYVVAPALYYLLRRLGFKATVFFVPLYFAHANAAALWGLIVYLGGGRAVTWDTVR